MDTTIENERNGTGNREPGGRGWSQKLLLLLLSTGLSLLLAEVVLRVVNPSARQIFSIGERVESERGKFCRYDERLGWVGIPDVEDLFEWVDCRHRVRQNKHGFRGSEYDFPRGERKRIVVLGDSFVWGFGVEEEQIFTSVLEKLGGDRIEVVNLGVSGYGTDQELLLWWELGRRFEPDVVVLVITPYTDLGEVAYARFHGRAKPFFRIVGQGRLKLTNVPVPREEELSEKQPKPRENPPFLARLASRSSLVSSVLLALARSDYVRNFLEEDGVLIQRLGSYEWEPLIHSVPPDPEVKRSWRKIDALVGKLRREVEATGARLVVTAVPSAMQIYEGHWEEMIRQLGRSGALTEWNRDAPTERVREVCVQAGIDFIDLTPPLRDAAGSDSYLYFAINRHWTASAHRIVAKKLYEELDLFRPE